MCEDNQVEKPRFLGFSCIERRGKDEKCQSCPLEGAEHCAAFIGYIQYQMALLASGQEWELGQINKKGRKVS